MNNMNNMNKTSLVVTIILFLGVLTSPAVFSVGTYTCQATTNSTLCWCRQGTKTCGKMARICSEPMTCNDNKCRCYADKNKLFVAPDTGSNTTTIRDHRKKAPEASVVAPTRRNNVRDHRRPRRSTNPTIIAPNNWKQTLNRVCLIRDPAIVRGFSLSVIWLLLALLRHIQFRTSYCV